MHELYCWAHCAWQLAEALPIDTQVRITRANTLTRQALIGAAPFENGFVRLLVRQLQTIVISSGAAIFRPQRTDARVARKRAMPADPSSASEAPPAARTADGSAPPAARQEITELLRAWRAGSTTAFEQLVPLVYDELRLRAKRCIAAEGPGHLLQPTALVHELYCRFAGSPPAVEW